MTCQNKDVVVYDGICVLCNFFLRWMLRNDSGKHFRYTNFQSVFIHKHYPNINPFDSIIVITKDDRKLYKGQAILYILKKLKRLKLVRSVLNLLPIKLINFFYDIIAKIRYRIFGKYDSCPMIKKVSKKI